MEIDRIVIGFQETRLNFSWRQRQMQLTLGRKTTPWLKKMSPR